MSKITCSVTPVGYVHADANGFTLALEPPFGEALAGLTGFSHIQVLWWADQLDETHLRRMTQCEQPYQKGPARLGIFATRSPVRPNPICLSTAPVISVDEKARVIQVAYIDAGEGSPILDIKPYTPSCDRVRVVTAPAWCGHWPQWFEDSADFDWEAELSPAG
jgi:tRNA-Thr(GGU) m(6)t(6)A37 methyltransferase TsaA